MRILLSILALCLIFITPVFADSLDKIIFSDFKEYEIAEIIDERNFRTSHITKVEGFTTTGDMFFIFTSDRSDFEKVMLLDRTGQWQKAELRDKIVDTIESKNSVVVTKNTQFHFLLDQHDRVYNKAEYKFFVKTFDKSIYSGTNFENFQGKISGAKISAIIIDPNGVVKTDLNGFVKNGLYEGTVFVPENLWQRGWYTVDIMIEFEGKFYYDQLSFYVFGEIQPSGSFNCPIGQTKVNGVCV